MVKDKKSEEFLGESKKRILAVSTRIKELLKKLTEMDKGSWLKRRAHGQQSLTSSATACSSRFWAVKKKTRLPASILFNYCLVRATIARKICFYLESPETMQDTSVFLLMVGIAKNLVCFGLPNIPTKRPGGGFRIFKWISRSVLERKKENNKANKKIIGCY